MVLVEPSSILSHYPTAPNSALQATAATQRGGWFIIIRTLILQAMSPSAAAPELGR
jgi:hypothetical protein